MYKEIKTDLGLEIYGRSSIVALSYLDETIKRVKKALKTCDVAEIATGFYDIKVYEQDIKDDIDRLNDEQKNRWGELHEEIGNLLDKDTLKRFCSCRKK